MTGDNIHVLISYSHDSAAHKQRVLDLADRLCGDGVDCHLDQYEVSPSEGWTRWMMNQIEESTFVLVVCTETYDRRFRGKADPNKGLGATWEGFIITQEIYNNASHNTKFIPIAFSADDANYIPLFLQSATRYRLDTEEGYEDLYRRLTAQPGVVKPPIGTRRTLPPRNLQSAVPSESASGEDGRGRIVIPAANPEKALPLREPLIYLHPLNSNGAFIPASRIERGERNLTLQLKPTDSKDSAFLSDLRRKIRNNIAVAYGDEALLATINSASQIMEAAGEMWSVVLELPDNRYHSAGFESSINGITPEYMAELRARRLLLNEKLPRDAFNTNSLMASMVENYVSQANGVVSFEQSPLPDLYQHLKNDVPLFLHAARLVCVMGLKLSSTVEHIFKLELHMQSDLEVAVSFQGQRPLQYQNAEPITIEVEGVCRLA